MDMTAQIEAAAQTADPNERRAVLRVLREEAEAQLGAIDNYLAAVDMERDAVVRAFTTQESAARANATIREELVRRGLSDDAEMDDAGMLSHDDLDALAEEGLLEVALDVLYPIQEKGGIIGTAIHFGAKFKEALHPRGEGGKFADKPGEAPTPKTRGGRKNVGAKNIAKDVARARRKPAAKPSKAAPDSTARREAEATRAAQHVPPPPDEAHAEAIRAESAKPTTPPPPELTTADQQRFHELTSSDAAMAATEGDPELLAEAVELSNRLGEQDWPTKGEVATRLLGDAHDTYNYHSTAAVGPDGKEGRVFSEEREKFHDAVFDALTRERNPDGSINPKGRKLKAQPPGKRWALFMGGGPASGKSSALKLEENADVMPEDAVLIDPDEIKGLIPEYRAMVAGGDRYAASGAHEESSFIAAELLRRAREQGLNVVMDGTGDSGLEKTERDQYGTVPKFVGKIIDARDAGYNARVFYVNAPTQNAEVRATKRAMRSGRWVPGKEIRSQHKHVSRNAAIVQDMAQQYPDLIQEMRGFDTTTFPPTKMFSLSGKGKLSIDSPDANSAFLAKQNEAGE
jgi:hypothetical protein